MSVNEQLAGIQNTLGKHTGILGGIKDELKRTRENTSRLFDENTDNRERLAKLETRADGFERQARNRGAISGGIVTSFILGLKMAGEWLAGK